MAFIRVHCDYCGGQFEIYKHNLKGEFARECPHCFQRIDRQTWEREVLPAFAAVEDANAELYKDHCDRKPLFSFDVIANHIFANGGNRG